MMIEPILMVAAPLVGAALMLVAKLMPRGAALRWLSLLPLGVLAYALAASAPTVLAGGRIAYNLGGFAPPAGIELILDGIAWLSVALATLIVALVTLASLSRGGGTHYYSPLYFFYLQIITAGMVMVALTGDLFTLFVAFEIVAIAAYVLIAWEQSDEGLLASLKYLFLSSVGILFFLIGVFLVYRTFGTLALREISAAVSARHPGGLDVPAGGLFLAPDRAVYLAVALLTVGIGVRTAFIPFHTWLPEAHAYAPHPISALLSGVLIKVSFFAMVRMLTVFSATYLSAVLLWIGVITALVAVIQALAQSDAKRLLAYHSISQMGFILTAVGTAGALSAVAAWTHAINHALFKSLLFLSVGTAVALRNERNLYRMRPIGRLAPVVSLGIIVGSLGIAGVPPFNGFASKYLVTAPLSGGAAYALLWVAAAGTVASFIKLSRIARRGPRDDVTAHDGPHPARPDWRIHLPILILSMLVIATGVGAQWWGSIVAQLTTAAGATPPTVPSPFSRSALFSALPIIGAGAILYRIVISPPGAAVTHRIRALRPELRTVLIFFVIGLALFAAAPWLLGAL